jgi:hypothetical protein
MLLSIIIFIFCLLAPIHHLHAELFFSNKESRLHLSSAAQLKLNTSINNFKGTLKTDPGANIQGSSIVFNHGALESQQQQSTLKGTLDSGAPNSILLQGNDILHAEPGSIIQLISISGANNRIEGQPTFNTPLSLFDPSTSVTLALQKKLNADIILNGGLVFLDDDLRLGDGITIQGPGTIECNQSALEIWGVDGTWSSSLTFINPDAIGINTRLALSSIWTLSGNGNLNGNGNVLDLSAGGQLVIADGAHIGISDLKIRGLHTNNLLFMGPTSKIDLSGVELELDGNYSTTLGGIFIDGSVSFLLKNFNFLIDQAASITFDGVRGFIDSLDYQNLSQAGQFQAPLPIFVDHIIVGTNLSANLTAGNLTILSSATIAESMGGGLGGNIYLTATYITTSIINNYGGTSGTPTSSYLISTIITTSHVGLDDTFWVPVDKNVIVGADTTIDASGNAMFFAHGDQPQLIVLPNNTLTLQNIELGRINENTFNINPSSSLYIGKNVQLELNQNLTFSQGSITFTGQTNLVNFRGIGGNKTLTITPPRAGQPPVMDIGSNTMVLQDIELSGLSNIKFSSNLVDNQVITGAILLNGGTRINIDRDTNFNFIVQGNDNVIRILKNNVKLTGSLTFGDAVDNDLSIDFILTEGLATENQIYFGDNFAYLFSSKGKASLYFKDYSVRVINQGSNSFVMDKGSLLDGNNLFVGTFPIKQLSFEIGLSRSLLLNSDQINAIDSSFARNFLQVPSATDRPITAYEFHKKRKAPKKNESEWLPQDKEEAEQNDARYQNLMKLFFENADHYTRGLITPLPITTPIGVGTSVQLTNASGTIQMDKGSSITKFGIDPSQFLNIILTDNCTIEQGTPTKIKAGDAFYVLGRNNKMIINDDFIVEGNIYFDTDAELIIECATHLNGKTPKIQLGANAQPFNLNMPQGSRLIARGRGDLLITPDSKIKSNASATQTRAELFFDDQIIVSLLAPGELNVEGNFNVRLTNQAELFIGTDHHVIFGDTKTKRVKIEQNISFDIDDARIRLDGTRETRRGTFHEARLSIQGCNVDMNFDHGAELFVGPSSTFELNTLNNLVQLSRLKRFAFGLKTKFYLDSTSNFILGLNDYTNKQYKTIEWDLERVTLDAQGRFVYIGLPENKITFYGVPQNIKVKQTGTSEAIMKTYIQRNTALTNALSFLDIDGLFYIRASDGTITLDNSAIINANTIVGF